MSSRSSSLVSSWSFRPCIKSSPSSLLIPSRYSWVQHWTLGVWHTLREAPEGRGCVNGYLSRGARRNMLFAGGNGTTLWLWYYSYLSCMPKVVPPRSLDFGNPCQNGPPDHVLCSQKWSHPDHLILATHAKMVPQTTFAAKSGPTQITWFWQPMPKWSPRPLLQPKVVPPHAAQRRPIIMAAKSAH